MDETPRQVFDALLDAYHDVLVTVTDAYPVVGRLWLEQHRQELHAFSERYARAEQRHGIAYAPEREPEEEDG